MGLASTVRRLLHIENATVIVLFSRPQPLSASRLYRLTADAFRLPFDETGVLGFYTSNAPLLRMVKVCGDTFSVLPVARPYVHAEELAAAAPRLSLPGEREAWQNHQAYVQLDFVSGPADLSPTRNAQFSILLRFAAQLVAAEATGVYLPDAGLTLPASPTLADHLRNFTSLDRLRESFFGPFWSARQEVAAEPAPDGGQFFSERFVQANALAHWTEFLEAFSDPRDGDVFLVKALLREGELCEYVWLEVQSILGDTITGELDSRPVHLVSTREGDRVQVQAASVGDWMYLRHGRLHGGFSIQLPAHEESGSETRTRP
jgi:uncharacterized protein YegJ (DUF2314 family)